MKKFFITFLALFILFSLPCFAQNLSETEEGAPVTLTTEESPSVVEKEASKPFSEQLLDLISQHWDKLVMTGYIIYNAFPVIGAIAKNKKSKDALKKTVDTYFSTEPGKEGSVTLVVNALTNTMTKFMNDTSGVLAEIQKTVECAKIVAEKHDDAEAQKVAMQNLALACQSAVALMATQLNDLVLNSPSISAKKKATIEAEWMEKNAELTALVEKVVSYDDQSESPSA